MVAAALALSLGRGERPAAAIEAVKPVHRDALAPREPARAATAATPSTPPADEPTPKLPTGRAAITPMDREVAVSYLADAWQSTLNETPSERTLALLCAHWAHETDHGRRMYAYNFGGIKGTGPGGNSVVIWTRELDGEARFVQRTFRAYLTPEEGARDYVNLLAQRYSAALRAAREASVERFVTALSARGYFTDDESTYLRSLARLARGCTRDLGSPASSKP